MVKDAILRDLQLDGHLRVTLILAGQVIVRAINLIIVGILGKAQQAVLCLYLLGWASAALAAAKRQRDGHVGGISARHRRHTAQRRAQRAKSDQQHGQRHRPIVSRSRLATERLVKMNIHVHVHSPSRQDAQPPDPWRHNVEGAETR